MWCIYCTIEQISLIKHCRTSQIRATPFEECPGSENLRVFNIESPKVNASKLFILVLFFVITRIWLILRSGQLQNAEFRFLQLPFTRSRKLSIHYIVKSDQSGGVMKEGLIPSLLSNIITRVVLFLTPGTFLYGPLYHCQLPGSGDLNSILTYFSST